MYALRSWSATHADLLQRFYAVFERALARADPLFRWVGYDRLERPVARVEKAVKGLLFDCRMCGQCVLSETGMSCPMNCPKTLRNGPCGGVRGDGTCEVKPDMRCVWVEAERGRALMQPAGGAAAISPPVDHRLFGRSSWLRAAREQAASHGVRP